MVKKPIVNEENMGGGERCFGQRHTREEEEKLKRGRREERDRAARAEK